MLDLTHLPAVDVHCHPFLNRGPLTAEQLTDLAAFPGGNTRGYMEQGGVAWDEALGADLLTNGGYRGLKSVIAYRTGLDISPLSRTPDQGLQALDAIKRGIGGGSMKKLRDHLLCRAMELAMEHDVPMQIHTGMGDYEI